MAPLAESPLKKTMVEHVPLYSGSPSAQPRSPIRKRTPGAITMQQKQAMIDNMQLESMWLLICRETHR
ncbi:hypothetical protein LB505_004760 [Fusarium chuoi]|nr:hypothetical protein LB503_001116 [Fusarium chuoi]KAI1045644.1 hypothetical protein LB505_004760 [Fusarium chuoi]